MHHAWSLFTRALRAFVADNGMQLAAGIAFYVLLSLVPLATFNVAWKIRTHRSVVRRRTGRMR
ncbi:MAG: hypothetical protein HOP12_02095 [Candidatus Eisenbacteria bacterium]|uniref:Uncharacterized protein n=1 Tax=Eiseniibacteriota bacterium TaxID=2212470 RepID=A0A849SC43_UNCEI|nr:hypothetical protein [Candidatus Eisenbacteria bacterium]